MAEERLPPDLDQLGHWFEHGPFTLDLYRLVCLFLADKRVAKLGPDYYHIWNLKNEFLRSEVTRILISTAIAIRIRIDQKEKKLSKELKAPCGKLYPNLPSRKSEPLTLREACNKIIHATKIRFDIEVPPSARYGHDVYLNAPYLYLYGERNSEKWRAKLSIVEFAELAATTFAR